MQRLHSILLALLVLAAPAHAHVPKSDPAAIAVARSVERALGGRERWSALPGVRWSFGVSSHDSVRVTRRHSWNKFTGQHRVEGTLGNGAHFVIVHTLGDTLHGGVWLDGRALTGDSLHTFIQKGNAMWVNDSYWFLMPYKLFDPGVILKSDSSVRDSTGNWDRIILSFDHVGLTPGDQYWVYVDHATHRIGRWEALLEGRQPPPLRYSWEAWQQHAGLWFATEHRQGAISVFTRDVETVRSFPAHEFRAP